VLRDDLRQQVARSLWAATSPDQLRMRMALR
jgi:hypothetical protein